MAKVYAFRIQARLAEFSNGFVSVTYDGTDSNVIHNELVQATFDDAKVLYQKANDTCSTLPHVTTLSMARYNDRKPPGFSNVKRLDYRGNT